MRSHILIIDDDEPIRKLMARTLEQAGYDVTTAADGETGLTLFGELDTWSLVLLDERMPGPAGHEILPQLHTLRPTVPVVLMSAFATARLAGESLRHGARGILTKPITPETLRQVVAGAIASRSAH